MPMDFDDFESARRDTKAAGKSITELRCKIEALGNDQSAERAELEKQLQEEQDRYRNAQIRLAEFGNMLPAY